MNATARAGLLPLVASALVLSACVSTSIHPAPDFSQRLGPAVSPNSVLLLPSAPTQPYVTLGDIEAWVSGFPSSETALRKVREAAAAVGADAIIKKPGSLFAEELGTTGQSVSPRTVSFAVSAIRYTGPTPQSP